MVARGRIYIKREQGEGTNDDAEWMALLYALDIAREQGASDALLVGDSMLVVKQASGAWPCRSSNLQRHVADFRAKSQAFDRIRIRHVRRTHNLAGIALEKMCAVSMNRS